MPRAAAVVEMHRQQRGFSLIELIVVVGVIVLVIYAGLPHFADALKQTHETAVELSARALRDGVMNAKAMQMLDGLSGSTYNLPRYADNTVDLSPAGFPSGTSRKPGDKLNEKNCEEIWRAVLDPNPDDTQHSVDGNFRAALDTTGKTAVCSYIYLHGGDMSIHYDPNTGKVWADAKFKGSVFSN